MNYDKFVQQKMLCNSDRDNTTTVRKALVIPRIVLKVQVSESSFKKEGKASRFNHKFIDIDIEPLSQQISVTANKAGEWRGTEEERAYSYIAQKMSGSQYYSTGLQHTMRRAPGCENAVG